MKSCIESNILFYNRYNEQNNTFIKLGKPMKLKTIFPFFDKRTQSFSANPRNIYTEAFGKLVIGRSIDKCFNVYKLEDVKDNTTIKFHQVIDDL